MVSLDVISQSGPIYPQAAVSYNHGLGAASGTDRIVLVSIMTIGPVPHPNAYCRYDGVNMTLVRSEIAPTYFGRSVQVQVYQLLDAALPATAGTYAVTYLYNPSPYDSSSFASSYTGVAQSAPPHDGNGNSNNPALSGIFTNNITLAASAGLIVDFAGTEPSTGTGPGTSTGQTQRGLQGDGDTMHVTSDKTFAISGVDSMSQTPSIDYFGYAHVLVELADSGSGATPNAIMFGANF